MMAVRFIQGRVIYTQYGTRQIKLCGKFNKQVIWLIFLAQQEAINTIVGDVQWACLGSLIKKPIYMGRVHRPVGGRVV